MKKIFYFIVITIFIISCNNNNYKTIISEEIIDSIYIPILDSNYSFLSDEQFATIDGNDVLITRLYKYGIYSDKIYFIDLKTKKVINELSLKDSISKDAILGDYIYLNKDSIIFIFDKYDKDSTFVLIDYKNKIKKVYSMDNPYFKGDTSLYISFSSPIIYYDNKVFFAISGKDIDVGTKEFSNIRYPIIGYLDLVKDTVILNNKLWYQNVREGLYYPNQAKIIYFTISHRGTVLISYANSSVIKEWNYKTSEINSFMLKSQVVDTILPEPYQISGYRSKTQAYNSFICYDKFLHLYSRRTFFPKNIYGKFKHLVVFFDTTFNYVGEAYNTPFMYDRKYFDNQKYRGWGMRPTEYERKAKLVKAKFKFGELNIDEIKSKIQKEKQETKHEKEESFCSIMGNNYKYDGYTDDLMINYTKKIFNIQDSTFVLFVITDQDCHSCDDYTLQFMQVNCPVINSTKTCLLLAGSNIDYFNRLTNKYNLTGVNNFAIDTTGVYTNYLHHFSMNNPRLLLVRNNKVVSDTIYMPDDLEQMVMNYIDFFNFQTE